MGLNNRDKQAKLKTQSLLDSERAGQQTVTTVTVDHGTVALPLESMAVSSSTTSNSSSSFQQSSSSTKTHTSAEKFQKTTEGRASEVRELGSGKDGQKFSTVSSMRSEANKSKQIDNIIEEIHHIASDTIGAAAMIGGASSSSAGLELPAKVTQKTVLVGGGSESVRKESFLSDSVSGGVSTDASQQVITTIGPSKIEISKVALESSALSSVASSSTSKVMQSTSAITKQEQSHQRSSASHGAVRSEKHVSESSAAEVSSSEKAESKSSKTMHSSSSTSTSKSVSTAQSKTAASSASETFHTSSAQFGDSVRSSLSATTAGRQNGVLSVDGKQSTAAQHLPDHSTFDQKSFQLVDADGKTRQQVDSQRFSMAQTQAPTTKIEYDAAGNQITSTSASYQAAQGYSTSSFESSGGVDLKSGTGKLTDADGKSRPEGTGQSQAVYDTAGNRITNTSSSYQAAQGYNSSSSFHTTEGVEQKSSNDTMSSSRSSTTKRSQNVASSKDMQSSTSTKDMIIDSTTLDNYSGQHANNMLMKTESAHTVASLSSAHDSLANTIQSTQLITESSASQAGERLQQHSASSKTIETSSHYSQMDEESRSRRKTSEYREQRESNNAIVKRKIYDEHGRRLNLIDEKIVPKDIITADLQDDVTNVTKTSFEAKLFNPKLKRWELVDQKTILEKDITTDIPVEIVQELEVERPELANITTTIQMTKVYDAKTKQWKTIDHKKHIDVLEKITYLEESSGRTELDESERTKNLKSMDMVDRVTIKEVSDLSDEKRTQASKTTKRRDEQTVQEQCICEICTCGRHNCYNCGGGNRTTQTKSSKYTTSSNSENFYHQENISSELTTSGRRGTWTIEDAEDHLNRRESYTIERSSTTQEASDRRLTWTKEDFEKLDVTKLKAEYVRPKPIKHEDNLKPEGAFTVPERTGYVPGERVKPIKPDDNLRPEGEFSTPEKPQYRSAERPKQVRPEDNLRPEGDFEKPEKPQYRPAERPKQIRPEDNLRPEGAFQTPERPEYRPGERPKPVRHDDNLRPEGDFERPEKTPFRPAERPKQVRPEDNLKTEGTFEKPEKPQYRPAERPKQVKPQDNLKPEGDFERPKPSPVGKPERAQIVKHEDNLRVEGSFERVEKTVFVAGERPKPIKPDDNLRPEGDFLTPEKQQYRPADRPKQIKPQDNLRPEGDFERPQKSAVGPGERPKPIKHDDNLRPEGSFERPEKTSFKPAERPKQIRPEDNLRTEGEFEKPVKPQFRPAERPKQVKPQDNLQIEGDYNTFQEYKELKQQKEAVLKEVHEPTIADGTVLVTTQTVTTILKGDKKQPTGKQITTSEVHDHATRSESELFTHSHTQQHQQHHTSEQVSSSTAINRAQHIEASTNERDRASTQRSTTKHAQSIQDVSGRNIAESMTNQNQYHMVNGKTVVSGMTEQQSHSHSVKSSSSSSKVHQTSSSVQQHTSSSTSSQAHQDSLQHVQHGETRHLHTNGKLAPSGGEAGPAGVQHHTREQMTGSQVSSSSSKIVIDGKVVTDKSASSKQATEKLAIDGVVVTDKSFVERQKTGFDGMESISSAQTTTGQNAHSTSSIHHDTATSSIGSHATSKAHSQTRSSNNIIHSEATNGHSVGRRSGVGQASSGQTTETQVKKLIGGKWVTKTIKTESKALSSEQQHQHGSEHGESKLSIADHVDRQQHHSKVTGTEMHTQTATSSSSMVSKSQSSSTVVSEKAVQRGVRTGDTTISAGSPSGRTGARGSSSIVLGESTVDSSSSKRQQTSTTKLIGGKLVHVANSNDTNNNTSTGAAKASSLNASNAHHSSLQEQLSSQTASSSTSSSSAMKSSKVESSSSTIGQQSSSQHYNRKNTFASSENVNNSILCRPAQTSTATATQHAANGVGGMSVSGSIQRKSISNLNDSAMYSTTNRTSYSSLHRRGKESAESRMQDYVKTLETGTITNRTVRGQPCPPPTLAGMGLSNQTSTMASSTSSTSAANQKSLRDYHSAMNVTRSSTKANASSISFGDDKFHGTSSYKVQYIQQHEGRCPAAVHDNLKLSKVTKQHTYYVRDKK